MIAKRALRGFLAIAATSVAVAAGSTLSLADGGAALQPGVKALAAGLPPQAIKIFSDAIAKRAVTGTDLARAYYLRGLAYRQAGKPAQAIADLSNALWFKGLAPAERADALLNRGLAYQAAGLADRGGKDIAEARTKGATEPRAIATAPEPPPEPVLTSPAKPAKRVVAAAESEPIPEPVLSKTSAKAGPVADPEPAPEAPAEVAEAPAETVVAAAPKPAPAAWSTSVSSMGKTSSAEPEPSSAAASATTEPPAAPAPKSTLAGLFSDLFSSGSSGPPQESAAQAPVPVAFSRRQEPVPAATAPVEPTATAWGGVASKPPAPVEVAAVVAPPVPTPKAAKPDPAPVPQTASAAPAGQAESSPGATIGDFFGQLFSGAQAANAPSTTETGSLSVPKAKKAAVQRVATVAPGADEAEPGPTPGGRRLQIASVRSEKLAQRVADKIRNEHGQLLAGAETKIESAVIGNMGTFYNIVVGPFASAKATEAACADLKKYEIDCFAVP